MSGPGVGRCLRRARRRIALAPGRLVLACAVVLAATTVDARSGSVPAAPAQTPSAQSPAITREAALAAARAIVAAARYATLVTLAEDGRPQARLVDPQPPDDRFTVWVATNPRTRKVAELRRDPRVTLLFANARDGEYVTLHGTATLVTDAAEKARHWSPAWDAFYTGGPSSEAVVLIRVAAQRLEVVSPGRGIDSDPVTWRPFTVVLP